MTKQQILDMTGLTEDEFYAQYPTEESFQMAMGGMVEGYKKGGWIQKATASIKRRGTEGVCTGSKFGGPSCRPGTKRYALAKTFRKMAKARKKEDGGMVEMYAEGGKLPEGVLRARLESHMSPAEASNYIANYKQGGVVDVYQLMGMPTPSMYGMGGTTNIGDLSHVISADNFPNMGYAMGGAINYPEGLQMPIFAMGGMTSQPTIINVEDGELLIDPKTNKILTKYLGGGMVRHPEYGQDIRGNVPVQTDDKNPKFVIPVKYADKFVKARKNNNTLEMEMYKNNITIEKAKNEAKDAQIAAAEEQKANKAMNRMMAKYGGTIQRMYAQGGMVPMYQGGATVNPFFQDITRNLQPSPFLQNLMQTPSASATLAPAARPYNSNVNMGAGLNTAVANYMGNNQFYQTGPNYTSTPTTAGNRSVRDMMSGLQPSPFLQRITEGVQPSPFLQRNSGRPSAQPTAQPSSATSAGMYNASRPTYTAPANTAAARPVGTRPATSARPTRPTFEPMTPMTMRGIDVNQLNPTSPAYTDNFDMGNVGENERMYEPYGSSFELTGDELWGSSDTTTIPGTGGELTADQLFGGSGNRNRGVGSNNQGTGTGTGTGAGMGNSQMDKYLMAAQFLPAAYNLGRGIFEKAWKPGSYETPANTKWEDLTGERGRKEMLGAYAVAQRNARQLGGSNVLAGLQAGSTAYQRNIADYEEALENRNKLGRAEMNRFNKQIEQSNMQMRMNRDYLAQQAKEKKAEMIGAGISNIGSGAGQLWQNKQMMDALRIAYPGNTYTPNVSGGTDTAGTISGQRSMFTPSPMTFREYTNIKNRRFSNSTNP